MKKSLIALAALAATGAFAQSSVTMSGLVDTGYVVTNNPGTLSDTKGLAANGASTTVLTPEFIPGFTFSVDWYSTHMSGAIAGISEASLVPLDETFGVNSWAQYRVLPRVCGQVTTERYPILLHRKLQSMTCLLG